MQIHFVGDVHAKFGELYKIIDSIPSDEDIYQVGDLGLGFSETVPEFPDNFHFIRGNHDAPDLCRPHKNYLGDYGQIDTALHGFFVSGAYSIDKAYRVEGFSVWQDEELSAKTMYDIYPTFKAYSPSVVITHDCPYSFAQANSIYHAQPTRTNMFLESLLVSYQPSLWVFGHHHKSYGTYSKYGTLFLGLAELEHKSIEIG